MRLTDRRTIVIVIAAVSIIATVSIIALASSGGKSDRITASDNAAAESGRLYVDCTQAVGTQVASTPVFSRQRLFHAVSAPGTIVAVSHAARTRGVRLGPIYGVPFAVRRATVRHFEPGGVDPVTIVSHTAQPEMVAGYLRCEGYERDRSGAGVSWSRATPSRSFVRSLPGAVVGGRQAANVDRVANRLAAGSRSSRLDAVTTGAASSVAGLVTARMVNDQCSLGRWAEQTATQRVRLHFLLNRRAQRAPDLAVATRRAVLRTSRVDNEIRVDVRSAAATRIALEFAGDARGEWTAFSLSC